MKRFAILGALALLVVCGCKKGPSFVGTWTTELAGVGPQQVVLNEDKSLSASASKSVGGLTIKVTAKGTWSNTDNDFTMTISDIKTEGLPPALQSTADAQIATIKGKPQTGTYKWNGDDEFTITSGTTTQDFKRVKAGS